MTDKTDPRLDVLRGPWLEWAGLLEGLDRWRRLLADFDAADRAAGIVRVDTDDEALVERLARARFEDWYGSEFAEAPPAGARIPHGFTAEARWYLAALREAAHPTQEAT